MNGSAMAEMYYEPFGVASITTRNRQQLKNQNIKPHSHPMAHDNEIVLEVSEKWKDENLETLAL
jgi:hypothetical protein